MCLLCKIALFSISLAHNRFAKKRHNLCGSIRKKARNTKCFLIIFFFSSVPEHNMSFFIAKYEWNEKKKCKKHINLTKTSNNTFIHSENSNAYKSKSNEWIKNNIKKSFGSKQLIRLISHFDSQDSFNFSFWVFPFFYCTGLWYMHSVRTALQFVWWKTLGFIGGTHSFCIFDAINFMFIKLYNSVTYLEDLFLWIYRSIFLIYVFVWHYHNK